MKTKYTSDVKSDEDYLKFLPSKEDNLSDERDSDSEDEALEREFRKFIEDVRKSGKSMSEEVRKELDSSMRRNESRISQT